MGLVLSPVILTHQFIFPFFTVTVANLHSPLISENFSCAHVSLYSQQVTLGTVSLMVKVEATTRENTLLPPLLSSCYSRRSDPFLISGHAFYQSSASSLLLHHQKPYIIDYLWILSLTFYWILLVVI